MQTPLVPKGVEDEKGAGFPPFSQAAIAVGSTPPRRERAPHILWKTSRIK